MGALSETFGLMSHILQKTKLDVFSCRELFALEIHILSAYWLICLKEEKVPKMSNTTCFILTSMLICRNVRSHATLITHESTDVIILCFVS